MRNGVSFLKQYPRGPRLSRTCRAIALSGALLVSTSLRTGDAATAACQNLDLPGTPAPALARLFTPLQAPAGAYTVTVLTEGIEAALARVKEALAPNAVAGDPPGSWQVQQMNPLEAFGTTGAYDRSKVARLYTGRRASVVRGPVERGGKVIAAVTLLSPYPDATLSRLEAGTLVIVIRVAGSLP
jgi:hypothetical protein